MATVVILAAGQSLSAQVHPFDRPPSESAEGPIARATALQVAKLEHSDPAVEFTRGDRVVKAEAPRAEATASAAPHSKRGIIGAVIGAAAGGLLGAWLAIGYATRDCGSSCSDERAMIATSLIGIPVAGGLVGYHIAK